MRSYLLLAAFALAGCTAMLGAPIRSTIEVEDDPFSPLITIRGPEGSLCPNAAQRCGARFFIRSFVGRSNGEVTHQVYVAYLYGGDWRLYRRANNEQAEPMRFTQIRTDVDCGGGACSYYEDFGVDVSDDVLRARATAGLSFKAYAQSGHELVVTLSPEMIQAQLAAVQPHRRP